MGAYLSTYAPFIPFIGAGMSPGVYDIPACRVRVRGAFTNTVPVDAYRGAGRPEAAYVIERLVDAAARELGVDPDALRRKNFIRQSAMPYATRPARPTIPATLPVTSSARRRSPTSPVSSVALSGSRKSGRLRGIGVATYIEACGNNGPDTAVVRLEADGTVTVLVGTQSTGQGHHTAFAQIIADHLGLPPERVRVIQGDTDLIATGTGTGGSSSIPCGGASVASAAEALAKNLKDLGADALEAAASDLEIVEGAVRVAGTDRAVSFAELAGMPASARICCRPTGAFVPEAADLSEWNSYRGGRDRSGNRSGELLDYVVVDDFGDVAQSIAARWPGAWRRRPGHRPGADGEHGLRS